MTYQFIMSPDQIQLSRDMAEAARDGNKAELKKLVRQESPLMASYEGALVIALERSETQTLEVLLKHSGAPAHRIKSAAATAYAHAAEKHGYMLPEMFRMMLKPFREDGGLKARTLRAIFGAVANGAENVSTQAVALLEKSGANPSDAKAEVMKSLQEQRKTLDDRIDSVIKFSAPVRRR